MNLHHGHSFGAGAIIAAVVVATGVAFVPSRRIAREVHLPPAERLSDTARAALKTQMHAHGRGMMELVSTVSVLDYEGAGEAAQRLLEEPRVARPLTGDATELNAALPPRFFALQDELYEHLHGLAQGATTRDPDRLADELAATTRTCVRCHEAYLQGR